MCSYGNADIYYNQNSKIFQGISTGECALQCSMRVFLIYTKCVQKHYIPGPTGANSLGLLLMLLFVCSEQWGIMGCSWWVSNCHGHALLSAPSAISLLQEVPENKDCVSVTISEALPHTPRLHGDLTSWRRRGGL